MKDITSKMLAYSEAIKNIWNNYYLKVESGVDIYGDTL